MVYATKKRIDRFSDSVRVILTGYVDIGRFEKLQVIPENRVIQGSVVVSWARFSVKPDT